MRISELYGRYRGQTVYVVGTGPSMRVFDLDALAGCPVVALNQAWRYWAGRPDAPALGLTVHPELILEYEAAPPPKPPVVWATKAKHPLPHLTPADPRYYVFATQHTDPGRAGETATDTLYLGEGIQATGLDLAARLGAARVVLVGVDMTALGGEHHGHDQHVRFHGRRPDDVYAGYRRATARVRTRLRALGVPVYSLTPFLGCGHPEEDYVRQTRERGLAPLPPPPDTSARSVPGGARRPRPFPAR